MTSHLDQIIVELERKWPAWQVWYVPKALGGFIWCARRWDDEHHVLNAGSAESLADLIEQDKEGS